MFLFFALVIFDFLSKKLQSINIRDCQNPSMELLEFIVGLWLKIFYYCFYVCVVTKTDDIKINSIQIWVLWRSTATVWKRKRRHDKNLDSVEFFSLAKKIFFFLFWCENVQRIFFFFSFFVFRKQQKSESSSSTPQPNPDQKKLNKITHLQKKN